MGRPGLLIADLRLRDQETGFELAQRMRLAHGDFPVIFASGETASEPLREVTEGGWPLLQKPIDADILQRAIRDAGQMPTEGMSRQLGASRHVSPAP